MFKVRSSRSPLCVLLQRQIFCVSLSAVFFAITSSISAAVCALCAGASIILPTWLTARYYFRYFGARYAKQMLAILCVGELLKWLSMALVLAFIFSLTTFPGAALAGVVAALLANWTMGWQHKEGMVVL